jgi:MSHA pilin protein MshD
LMDEILAKNFDDATPVGGLPACSPVTSPCTVSTSLGPEGSETRPSFNDVDDYHYYCGDEPANTGWPLVSSIGFNPDGFNNYRMRICVGYDDDYDGVINEAGIDDLDAKLITIEIFPPQVGSLGEAITFTAYKGNF